MNSAPSCSQRASLPIIRRGERSSGPPLMLDELGGMTREAPLPQALRARQTRVHFPAPSAARTENSRRRSRACASDRFVMFADAMRRRDNTAPSSKRRACRADP
jgi:hypothetical protein